MIEQVAVNALIVGCSAALLALGLSLVRSTVGFFDFSLAGIYTLAGYANFVTLGAGLPPPLAISAALLIAIVVAVFAHVVLYEPLRRAGATPEVQLIASLSLLLILQNVIPLFFGDAILSLPGDAFRGASIHLGPTRITRVEMAIVIISAVATATLLAALRYTDLGLQMRAVAQDRQLSRTYGVQSGRVVIATVVVSAALAAGIGILNGFDTDLTPTMGFRAVLLAAVATVVGGPGSILGVFLGALLVATAQQVAALSLPVQWQDTIVFSCLILFVVTRPYGVLGRREDKPAV